MSILNQTFGEYFYRGVQHLVPRRETPRLPPQMAQDASGSSLDAICEVPSPGAGAGDDVREEALASLVVLMLDDSDRDLVGSYSSLLRSERARLASEHAKVAVRAFLFNDTRESGVEVIRRQLGAGGDVREEVLAVLVAGLGESDPDIVGTCASILAMENDLPAFERANAAVRAFLLNSSRALGLEVIREMLAEGGDVRERALLALRAGFEDHDPDIAETCASLLAAEQALSSSELAKAAVHSFLFDGSRTSGLKTIRELLNEGGEAREDALSALRLGLGDPDPDIVETSWLILAEEEALPALV